MESNGTINNVSNSHIFKNKIIFNGNFDYYPNGDFTPDLTWMRVFTSCGINCINYNVGVELECNDVDLNNVTDNNFGLGAITGVYCVAFEQLPGVVTTSSNVFNNNIGSTALSSGNTYKLFTPLQFYNWSMAGVANSNQWLSHYHWQDLGGDNEYDFRPASPIVGPSASVIPLANNTTKNNCEPIACIEPTGDPEDNYGPIKLENTNAGVNNSPEKIKLKLMIPLHHGLSPNLQFVNALSNYTAYNLDNAVYMRLYNALGSQIAFGLKNTETTPINCIPKTLSSGTYSFNLMLETGTIIEGLVIFYDK